MAPSRAPPRHQGAVGGKAPRGQTSREDAHHQPASATSVWGNFTGPLKPCRDEWLWWNEVGVLHEEGGAFPRACSVEVKTLSANVPAHRGMLRVRIAAVANRRPGSMLLGNAGPTHGGTGVQGHHCLWAGVCCRRRQRRACAPARRNRRRSCTVQGRAGMRTVPPRAGRAGRASPHGLRAGRAYCSSRAARLPKVSIARRHKPRILCLLSAGDGPTPHDQRRPDWLRPWCPPREVSDQPAGCGPRFHATACGNAPFPTPHTGR